MAHVAKGFPSGGWHVVCRKQRVRLSRTYDIFDATPGVHRRRGLLASAAPPLAEPRAVWAVGWFGVNLSQQFTGSYSLPQPMHLASHSNDALSHVCSACERPFAGPGPLNFHRRSCRTTKRQLRGTLAKARELWEAKKRRSKGHPPDEPQAGVATGTAESPLTQVQGPFLAAAVPATPPSGSGAVWRRMTEAGGSPLLAASAPIPMDSAGVADSVCG